MRYYDIDFVRLFIMFIRISIGDIGSALSYMIQSGIIGLLTIALIGSLVCGLIFWHKKKIADTQKEKAKYILTTALAICMVVIVIMFDMYQFWTI